MIPMVDLKRQYQSLKTEIDEAVADVLAQTQFILGPNVSALEKDVAAYHGLPHAIGVANGTDALLLALRACGVGPGDEVITTPFTFIATAEVVALVAPVRSSWISTRGISISIRQKSKRPSRRKPGRLFPCTFSAIPPT